MSTNQDARERYFYDTAYEVWRNGGNPDAVDYDRCNDHYDGGDTPDETAASELRRQRRRREAEE
jgi:hypothetical protein